MKRKRKNIRIALCFCGLLFTSATPVPSLAAPDVSQRHLKPACKDTSGVAKDDSTGESPCIVTEPFADEEHSDLILSQRWKKRGDQEPSGPSEQELSLFYPPGSRRPLWGY
jgi:hypothetical protein